MKLNIIENMKSNWKAWLTVAMINIPLSISLAVASWATPLQWLITGIWAWIIASIFASSNHNIFGVAGALSSILLAFALSHWPSWALLLPMIAIVSWAIMLLVYLLRITKYITLIPSTALHWFLISVWITIALGQLSWALWLNDPALQIATHKEIYMNIWEVIKHISQTNIAALVTFGLWLLFLIVCKKRFPAFPSVITLTIIWIWVWFMVSKWYLPKILLLTDKFPELNFALFQFPFPSLGIDWVTDMIGIVKAVFITSLVVAIIAILETIISAKIAEKITKQKFDKDKEVLWLALSNIWSWFMWWLPSTAVFIRTALNIKSWATSKYAAFLTSIFTLLISAALFNWAFKFLPFPIIAAILMNIALWLIDINLLKKLYSLEKTAFYITLVTAILSVVEEPTYWILAWTAITLMIFIKKVTQWDAKVSIFRNKEFLDKLDLSKYVDIQDKNDIILMKFVWWLNYLNIENNINNIEKINKWQTIIFSFSHMWDLDIDWMEALEQMIQNLRDNNVTVYISWLSNEIEETISKFHIYHDLKKEWNIISSTSLALDKLLAK